MLLKVTGLTHSINQVHNVTGRCKAAVSWRYTSDVDENVRPYELERATMQSSADEGVINPASGRKGKTNSILVLDVHLGSLTMSVEAHTGGADEAALYGWVDFNGNGTFDEMNDS